MWGGGGPTPGDRTAGGARLGKHAPQGVSPGLVHEKTAPLASGEDEGAAAQSIAQDDRSVTCQRHDPSGAATITTSTRTLSYVPVLCCKCGLYLSTMPSNQVRPTLLAV